MKEDPDCTLCGRSIRCGLEVTIGKKPYHPGCAVTAAKEKQNESDDSRRNESHEGRVGERANALVN